MEQNPLTASNFLKVKFNQAKREKPNLLPISITQMNLTTEQALLRLLPDIMMKSVGPFQMKKPETINELNCITAASLSYSNVIGRLIFYLGMHKEKLNDTIAISEMITLS